MKKPWFNEILFQQLYLDITTNRDKLISMLKPIVVYMLKYHKLYNFEPYDDLLQIGTEAVIKQLDQYNPSFKTKSGKTATAYNYFAKTAQQSMHYYTIRQKKYRETPEISENVIYTPDDSLFIFLHDFDVSFRPLFNIERNKHLLPYYNAMYKHMVDYHSFDRRIFYSLVKEGEYGDDWRNSMNEKITTYYTILSYFRYTFKLLKQNKSHYTQGV